MRPLRSVDIVVIRVTDAIMTAVRDLEEIVEVVSVLSRLLVSLTVSSAEDLPLRAELGRLEGLVLTAAAGS